MRVLLGAVLLAGAVQAADDYDRAVCDAMDYPGDRKACYADLAFIEQQTDPCRVDVACWGKQFESVAFDECNMAQRLVQAGFKSLDKVDYKPERFIPAEWIGVRAGKILWRGERTGSKCVLQSNQARYLSNGKR